MSLGRAPAVALTALLLAGCGARSTPATDERWGIDGRVQLGPQCPVVRQGDPCPNRPASGSRVTVVSADSQGSGVSGDVVARTTTLADGSFHVALSPGTYLVTAEAGMSCRPVRVQVSPGATARVDILCDTGIR